MDNYQSEEINLIQKQFDLKSEEVFLWKVLPSTAFSIKFIAKQIGNLILFICAPFIIFCLIELYSKGIAFFFALFIFTIAITLQVRQLYKQKFKKTKHRVPKTQIDFGRFLVRQIMNSITLFATLTVCTGTFVYIISTDYIQLFLEFKGTISTKQMWFFFYVDNILKVLLFDTAEIFDLKFSNIEAKSSLGRGLVWVLNILISGSIIEIIVFFYRSILGTKELYGTLSECFQEFFFYNLGNRKMSVQSLSEKKLQLTEFSISNFYSAFIPKN